MDANKPGDAPPPKPWERAGTSSGPTPFKPPSAGSTSAVVEQSGTAKPGEILPTANASINRNIVGRPVPPRPWEQNHGNTYGGYNSLNSGLSSNMYNSYGGFGSPYSGGLYNNSNYNRGGYGGLYGGSGMYGGSMYNGGYGGTMGGYGMGGMSGMGGMGGMGMGGPYGNQDPNNPYGLPPSPPGFWMSFLRVMHGVVDFFGRISILIDQNTHAFHMFMSALLQLFDRSGVLYGELARFVLRILGFRIRSRRNQPRQGQLPGPPAADGQKYIEGPKDSGSWDGVWGEGRKGSS